jgi:LysR family transcriptional regulator, low CO2-responsive transcriptional regulator
MAITITQLRAFIAVVEGGSVTAAADELVVTQPSVSSALAALARELGCELFERSGRGIQLTDAGRAFAPYAIDVLGLLSRGRDAAREAEAEAGRRVRIAAVTTAAESFVPPLMRAFSDGHPDTELTLVVGNHETVLEQVLGHAVDVAITGRPPADERLIAEPLRDNEIACITAPDDQAAGKSAVAASELSERAWLLREPGSGTRVLNEQFLAARGLHPDTRTLGSNGAIKQAARAGLGISLLSRDTVRDELSAGLLGEIALTDAPAARPWFMLRSSVGPTRSSVQALCEFLRQAAA